MLESGRGNTSHVAYLLVENRKQRACGNIAPDPKSADRKVMGFAPLPAPNLSYSIHLLISSLIIVSTSRVIDNQTNRSKHSGYCAHVYTSIVKPCC